LAGKLQKWFNDNIWDVSSKSVGPYYDLKGTTAYSKFFGEFENFSDENVSEKRAHQISTVYTCINVRAQTVASLPINIIKEDSKGLKKVLEDHPAYYPLAHEPNSYMSSANLFMTSMIHSDSWGDSIIAINRDSFMRPTSFEIIMPGDWQVTVVDGKAFYKIRGLVYNSSDVLHFRWFSLDGLNGISPIRQNMITMGKAMKLEKYSSMAIGQKPPGILSYEGDIRPETKAENQKSWSKDLTEGRTPILSGKWNFQSIMLSPDEAQYILTAGLTDQKIAGIFRVPPVFLQDYQRATWSNAEESDLIFVKHTIMPIIRIIEQECNMKLFTDREKKKTYVKFNLNGLLRGDLAARQAFYQSMVNTGVMSRNEARGLEDMNAYPGGDDMLVQSAMAPADMLRDFYKNKVLPTAPVNGKEKLNGQNIYN
jgi:HK97 family phage portal protein